MSQGILFHRFKIGFLCETFEEKNEEKTKCLFTACVACVCMHIDVRRESLRFGSARPVEDAGTNGDPCDEMSANRAGISLL